MKIYFSRQTVMHEMSCWHSWLYCSWSPLILLILIPLTSFSSLSHTRSSICTPPGYSRLRPFPSISSWENTKPEGGARASMICLTRSRIVSEFSRLDSSERVTSTSVDTGVPLKGRPIPRVMLGLRGSHGSEIIKAGNGLL